MKTSVKNADAHYAIYRADVSKKQGKQYEHCRKMRSGSFFISLIISSGAVSLDDPKVYRRGMQRISQVQLGRVATLHKVIANRDHIWVGELRQDCICLQLPRRCNRGQRQRLNRDALVGKPSLEAPWRLTQKNTRRLKELEGDGETEEARERRGDGGEVQP